MTALRYLLVVSLLPVASIRAAEYVWIEAESIAKPPAGFKIGGWGNKQYLSGESWLFAGIDGKDAEALPADGITLSFPFETKTAGEFDVWGRIGYEFARSPFLWRVDGGAWVAVGPDVLTTDLMVIAEWTEIAWLQLGKAKLAPGKHTLEIKFERRVLPNKKQPERILAGFDCFCLTPAPFRPHGPHKPDADWKKDIDRAAEKQVFAVPSQEKPRLVVPLKGTWQIARWDEQEIVDRAEPVRQLPTDYKELFWAGVKVPGNRDLERPDMLYCHRFLYRTKIKTGDTAGKTVILRFPSTALMASVFVNGKCCGGNDTPCAAWEVDITSALQPGNDNELIVAIKDCYYAIEKTGDGKVPRLMFNYPADWFYNKGGVGATRFADYPVLFQVRGAGIFETPELIVTDGPIFIADVFAKPSVAKKELGLEITLRNSSDKPVRISVGNDIIPVGGAGVEKRFAPKQVDVPARGESTVELVERWEKPRLWWPDDPQEQELFTRISIGEKVVDLVKTKFGFREWCWSGKAITLNGIPWHFRADLMHNGKLHGKDLKKVAGDWQKAGINTVRYWGHEPWVGDSQRETLDWYDKIGMPIRRTGIFDGQIAPYQLAEQKDGKTVARKKVFGNWIKQMKAWVKAERNHPSIFMWSVENEITYINIRNLGWLDACEPEIRRGVQEVMKLDPTRPAMIDGGDALRDRSLPIYGNHYNEANFRNYPDEAYTMNLAYTRNKTDPAHNPWPIGDDRPLFLGETFFANGFPPAAYSAVMGEGAFLGRAAAEPGVRLFARMLAEGYRWHGIAGFHFWFAGDSPDNEHYKAFQPVCALVKEWDTTFGYDDTVKRTIKVFNDTRFDDPIEVEIDVVSRKTLGRPVMQKTFQIMPGHTHEFTVDIENVHGTQGMAMHITCRRNGVDVFSSTQNWNVIGLAPQYGTYSRLYVLDPKGIVKSFLKDNNYDFVAVDSFETIADSTKLLVVGPDALTPKQATDSKWQALAANGCRVLVLDQENPLHFQAVPADLEVTRNTGRIAFPENLGHDVFKGLTASAFFCRSGDQIVYRNAYRKATRGARSLLQCDDELSCTALVECSIDRGLLMLCQAPVGSKLATDAVCKKLFSNMLRYCDQYKPIARPTTATFAESDPRRKVLDATGLKYTKTTNVVAALSDEKSEVVIADASPANLKLLAGVKELLQKFTERGGQLMLWGLTNEGLADFNRLVGVSHALRPFKMERVTVAAKRDPLAAGLSNRDVALEGTEKIFPWAGDRYPANDTFTNIVDLDDIAPFGKSDKNAHGWSQMTNGLTSADSWKFIMYHNLKEQGDKPHWEAEFPKEEEIEQFSIIINAHYHRITKMRLIFDGNEKDAVTLDLKPEAELRQDFDIPPRKFKEIALEPLAWQEGKQPVIGVDNIWITVKRDSDYKSKVVPVLNIGGLVKYRFGKGAIILNQLRIQANEPNPINAEKKQTIVATLLRNMGASFAAEKPLIAGANMAYQPIPLDDKCNQFLTADKGWISGQPDLAQFPVGNQKLAGVNYLIRDFKTSPLPSCIMLAGPGAKGQLPKNVAGISVNARADALFFLHTFHRLKDWKPDRDKKEPPVVFAYLIHYADGTAVEVPVRYERGVGHWISAQPSGVAEASVAWSAAFPKETDKQAVVYQIMWKNPRASEAIKSIDLKYDDKTGNQYGIPIVLGITAGKAE